MGNSQTNNALRRLANAGRAHHQSRALTLQKGLRLSLARVADDLLGLPMAMLGAAMEEIAGEDLPDKLVDQNLLLHLDGPKGRAGAAMLDPALVGGLIQQQTVGLVREDDGAARRMTRTDAALCAPLIDAVLEDVVPMLDDPAEAELIDGFRFGVRAQDGRALAIALDASDYVSIRLTIDVALGVRQGELTLFFPKPDARSASSAELEPDASDAASQPQLADTLMTVRTCLEMVVCRMTLTLEALRSLKPGDTLEVPPGHFPEVQLTTLTGRVVGRGTVGHVDGVRAVKPKPKPRHASQPMRRASDAPMVETPDIVLPEGHDAAPAPMSPSAAPALPDLPTLDDMPEIAALANDLPDLPDIGGGAEIDLPAMDDLPGLDDLPDLDAPPSPPKGPEDADLPDLDDLPDLADLPDLSDLPPLKAAG